VKSKKVMNEVRRAAYERRNGLFVRRGMNDIRSNFPLCQTCRREVEAVELRNFNRYSVELWARCHGKEDWYLVKFPWDIGGYDPESEVVSDHIRMAMTAFTPFSPREDD